MKDGCGQHNDCPAVNRIRDRQQMLFEFKNRLFRNI